MKHSFVLTFLLACLVSCTISEPDSSINQIEPMVMQKAHITPIDIICIDGKMLLSVSLEDALEKGISEDEYNQVEKDLQEFNEYTDRVLKGIQLKPTTKSNPLVSVASGFLQSQAYQTGYDTSAQGNLDTGNYMLIYQLSSTQLVNHEYNIAWANTTPTSIMEYASFFQGYEFFNNVGSFVMMAYQCDAITSGVCYWQLFRME